MLFCLFFGAVYSKTIYFPSNINLKGPKNAKNSSEELLIRINQSIIKEDMTYKLFNLINSSTSKRIKIIGNNTKILSPTTSSDRNLTIYSKQHNLTFINISFDGFHTKILTTTSANLVFKNIIFNNITSNLIESTGGTVQMINVTVMDCNLEKESIFNFIRNNVTVNNLNLNAINNTQGSIITFIQSEVFISSSQFINLQSDAVINASIGCLIQVTHCDIIATQSNTFLYSFKDNEINLTDNGFKHSQCSILASESSTILINILSMLNHTGKDYLIKLNSCVANLNDVNISTSKLQGFLFSERKSPSIDINLLKMRSIKIYKTLFVLLEGSATLESVRIDKSESLTSPLFAQIQNHSSFRFKDVKFAKINSFFQESKILELFNTTSVSFENIKLYKLYKICGFSFTNAAVKINSMNASKSQTDKSLISAEYAKISIMKSEFANNLCAHGVINIERSQIILNHSVFFNNTATYGGALQAIYLESEIDSCLFKKNSANFGGCIEFSYGTIRISNSKFIENSSPHGPALRIVSSIAKFFNISHINNYGSGTLVYSEGDCTVHIESVTSTDTAEVALKGDSTKYIFVGRNFEDNKSLFNRMLVQYDLVLYTIIGTILTILSLFFIYKMITHRGRDSIIPTALQ